MFPSKTFPFRKKRLLARKETSAYHNMTSQYRSVVFLSEFWVSEKYPGSE